MKRIAEQRVRREMGFREKCGRRKTPDGRRKGGNVMRLKIPKVTSEPSTAEESSEDRVWDLLAVAHAGPPYPCTREHTLLSSIL